MKLSLSPELERQIAERVATGRYASSSEVVVEALHLLFDTEIARARLGADIQIGIDELDRGACVSGEELFADVDWLLGRLARPG